jgi:hypothetical protein
MAHHKGQMLTEQEIDDEVQKLMVAIHKSNGTLPVHEQEAVDAAQRLIANLLKGINRIARNSGP